MYHARLLDGSFIDAQHACQKTPNHVYLSAFLRDPRGRRRQFGIAVASEPQLMSISRDAAIQTCPHAARQGVAALHLRSVATLSIIARRHSLGRDHPSPKSVAFVLINENKHLLGESRKSSFISRADIENPGPHWVSIETGSTQFEVWSAHSEHQIFKYRQLQNLINVQETKEKFF